MDYRAKNNMASFRIDDILARPQVSRSQTGSGIGASTPIPNYQQLSFGVDQILARHETEQRERLPVLGKKDKKKVKIMMRPNRYLALVSRTVCFPIYPRLLIFLQPYVADTKCISYVKILIKHLWFYLKWVDF